MIGRVCVTGGAGYLRRQGNEQNFCVRAFQGGRAKVVPQVGQTFSMRLTV